MSGGKEAERRVEEAIAAVLPQGARLWANVRFLTRERPDKPAYDGEADLVIAHPKHGILVIETKGGEPARDAQGRWFLGSRQLERSPFAQAEGNKHALLRGICEALAIPERARPRAGHAVAFPDADLRSLPRGHALLGPDVAREIVLDAAAFESEAATRRALEQAWGFWTGDGTRGNPITGEQMDAIGEYIAPVAVLHRLISRDVEATRDRLLVAGNAQRIILNQHRATRRLEITGPAGSGKSLLAVEKARRLARDGFKTLYCCFNQALATAVGRELADQEPNPDARPEVTTFHGLCERLGRAAGTLPPAALDGRPAAPGWFDTVLPKALDDAIDAADDERYHAIVVDEGQDFDLAWLTSLEFLLRDRADGILWIFHDPGQALFRDDRVAELGLSRIELLEDYRSPAPVASLAARFYHGPGEPYAVAETGREPVIIEAAPGRPTLEAVRRQLHVLVEEEGIRTWQIAVLSGAGATRSEVWRHRTFGNCLLWNGALAPDGSSLRLPASEVPDLPPEHGVVLFETIRRFKGLERPVILLCELPEEDPRLDALLYTGLTRATAHLVAVVPPKLAQRLRTVRGG